jgi:predicted CXXCH cytochrome family protein
MFWTATAAALFLMASLASADTTIAAGESCASSSCHADHQSGTNFHNVKDGQEFCADCHVADEAGDHEFHFAASGGQLCASCHLDLTEHEYVHGPVEAGLCTFCHSAHETPYPQQMKFPPEALCVSCHDDLVPEGVKTVHGPVGQGLCTSCHDPHSSSIDDYLVDEVPQLCFNCHDQDQTDHDGNRLPAVEPSFVDKSLNQHPPFARGDCLLCHDPHASDNIRLQRRPYSHAFYVEFSSEKYFCLMCHGDKIFTEPRTLISTQFRNGNLNLHYRHVDQKKGRGCRACHHQHASRLEAQIATDTPFGKQNIGIRAFAKTENGGTCESLCHRPVRYDRVNPVDNLFMVTPREGVDASESELTRASQEHDGTTLFMQRCAGCHGDDAEGKIGPGIAGATLDRVLEATDRVDLMADLASLAPEDLRAIVEFLPAGTPVVAPPQGASDETILFSTNCAGCHGPDAGGRIGPDIRGSDSEEITEAIDRVAMMVAMKALSPESINDIGKYLSGLAVDTTVTAVAPIAAAPDGKVIFSMNCLGCHGAEAQGQIGPSIRGMSTHEINEAIGIVPMMAGLKGLGSAEREAVGRYLSSLSD